MTVIVCHQNADFDCMGSLAAAACLYPDALLVAPGSLERNVRAFSLMHPELFPALTKIKDLDLTAVHHLILVDCHDAERIGALKVCFANPACGITIFDHHPLEQPCARPATCYVRTAGSTVTLLVAELQARHAVLPPHVATIMLLGVYEDTGGLRFKTTIPEDCRAVAWLLEQGADLGVASDILVPELSSEQVGLLHDLLTTLQTTMVHGVAVSQAYASRQAYIADLAGLVQRVLEMENLDVLIVSVLMGDRCFLIGRSRVSDIDLAQLLRRFGGGGHAGAASATVHDTNLRAIRNRLLTALPEVVHPVATVADVMSTQIHSVDAGSSIAEARDLLMRYNHSALPVMRMQEMVGVITRKVAEKAVFHGLGTRPVTEVMHTEVFQADPAMPLHHLTAYMVGGDRRFIPVFHGGRLVGVVTRTDLLRHMQTSLHGETQAMALTEDHEAAKERLVRHRLEKQLEPRLLTLLHELGQHGQQLGVCVYSIGGFVRDLLLDIANTDIDITVEGDGIRFAETFANVHGAHVRTHQAFGTAVIVMQDGTKIDVASTRLEYYGAPGMLPSVERATLRQDLYRRDFIINTGAIALNPDRFGTLLDFFGVQEDLRARRVRVLHNLSFIEDPTRAFRAVRFEQRLSFTLDAHTEGLLRSAVRAGVVGSISGKRLLNELRHIFMEHRPRKALLRLGQLGLLPAIHPDLHETPHDGAQYDEVQDVLAWYGLLFLERPPVQAWMVWLLMMTDRLDNQHFQEACTRLSLPERLMKHVFSQRHVARKQFSTLRQLSSRDELIPSSKVYALLHGLPLELLLYGVARTKDQAVRRLVSHYFTHLAEVQLLVGGDELRALGVPAGPAMRRIKTRLLYARLDGVIVSKDQEQALAVQLLEQELR